MEKDKLLQKQKELTERLKAAARAYYDEDTEIMSNFEYDKRYDELIVLEAETGVIFAGSPTRRVGYEVSSELVKQTHPEPMLSLNKTKSVEDLTDWLADQQGLLSWKLDGLTVALTYEGGALTDAVTRGNGVIGEVVTSGARTFTNLPLKIPYDGKLVLRGEAVIRYSDFEKINREIADVSARHKNPRNLVSGSVRQLDSSVTARRHVRFYAFALVADPTRLAEQTVGTSHVRDAAFQRAASDRPEPQSPWRQVVAGPEGLAPERTFERTAANEWTSRRAQLDFLRAQGFETVRYEMVEADGLGDAIAQFSRDAAAPGFDLPVDGLVLEYDDVAYSLSLGATSKYPRDAMAFKWQDEEAETELLEIEWSASRTGLINPIAVFAPVELEGTTVSRASVHNVSILEELALGRGDRIKVYKANMIIPQISANLTRSGTERPPEICPVCGAQTELRNAGGVKTLFCTNEDCPARKIKAFAHFVSRPCMNIEGLSEQTLEKLIASGLLREPADIFRLKAHRDVIVRMEGFGERSFEKLTAAIERARTVTANRLLAGLGVPEVGSATAKAIARSLGNDWTRIVGVSAEELAQIPGVGAVIADFYTRWFADPQNKAMTEAVVSEVRFADPVAASPGFSSVPGGASSASDADTNARLAAAPGSGTNTAASSIQDACFTSASPIAGMTFVITGSLEGYKSRDLLREKIEFLGGKTTGSVSAKTDYLINNDAASPSAKNKKARELGVAVITEAEFEAMIQ